VKLFNSYSQTIERFITLKPTNVKMYVCGITPYDTTHLGHAFVYVTFDAFKRFLEFKGYKVTYTQNVTDIDDGKLSKTRLAVIYIKKLFVGSLPWEVDDQKLGDLFSQFGSVVSAVVLKDRMTGRSRGFGFVEMANDNEATEAIEKLNGSDLDGRKIVVNEARPREDR